MNTTNHKPATTSDILPGIPATEPQTDRSKNPASPKSNNPFSATTRARCGKVARLPKEIRDQLNQMLLDGVPHVQIIQKLREKFGPQPNTESNVVSLNPAGADTSSLSPSARPDAIGDGERAGVRGSSAAQDQPPITDHQSLLASLTPQHLTTWKRHGGYRDWLRDQQRIEECKLRHELTLELARSAEGLASYQAAPKVAVAQICQTIIDLGPEGLKESVQGSPLNCFRLLNALARLINSGLKCENQIQKTAIETNKQKLQGLTRERLHQIEAELNLL
jgi:hypothetical protein